MQVADVEACVAEISQVADDPEKAHMLEDELWERVLEAIAQRETTDPEGIAEAALQTRKIHFPRWCA
jgi:hypothetical protein